jgi:hypothetical protein
MLLLIMLLFCCKLNSAQAVERAFHLILDIDYTLFHVVDERVSKRTIMGSDKLLYEPIAWGVEGIENALARGVKISFFSGGEEDRNISLLKQVKLSDGRSLFEVADGVYSRKHLEVVSDKGTFSERYKKNLEILGFDMKRSLLLDDLKDFVPNKHIRNILWIGKTYHHFNSYSLAQKATLEAKRELKYIPVTEEQWFISKNKMKYVFELILDANEKSKKTSDILSYINKYQREYIPYKEILTSKYLRLLRVNEKPSVCFRNYRFFKRK